MNVRAAAAVLLWLGLCGAGTSLCRAAPLFVQPHLPDFYQHQKSGPLVNVPGEDLVFDNPVPQPGADDIPSYSATPLWWEAGGGWCCITAYVNALHYLERQFAFTGLFTRPGAEDRSWQQRMVYAIEDMADHVFGLTGAAVSIPAYLRALQAQAHATGAAQHLRLASATFELGAAQDDAPEGTQLAAARWHLCRGRAVVLQWHYSEGVPAGETAPWWANGFHAVSGAAVNCDDPDDLTLMFADPDKRNVDEAGGWLDVDLREPYPDDPALPLPAGSLHYEAVTLDARDCIVHGIYRGACLSRVIDIGVVSVPASSTAALLAIALLAGAARRCTHALPTRSSSCADPATPVRCKNPPGGVRPDTDSRAD